MNGTQHTGTSLKLSFTKRRYRCSKGHEWTEKVGETPRTFSFPALQTKAFCMMCAVQLLAEQVGTVEELA